MRKLFTPSTLVPCAIVAAVAAIVVSANIREGRRSRRPFTSMVSRDAPGGPSTSREGLSRLVVDMEARLKTRPDDFGAAVQLADALLRQGRVTGNAGLTIRAEQALKQALREDPGNYDATRMLGSLYLSQHKFKDALVVAEKCRAMRPADAFNYGVIGDAHLELGDYEQAFDAFDRMMQLRPSAASYARVAYARELQGNLAGALQSMKLAADASGDLEGLAWARSQVGELYLRLDNPRDALVAFAAASEAFPGHPFAVAGYAKALEALGQLDDARALLEDLVRKSPTPDLHARLGELFEKSHGRDEAEREYALAEAGWRSDAPEPKNLARFLADRGRKIEEAVSIAEAAAAERQDIFTQDALAWSYFKAGRIEDAKRTISMALRTGTRDRDILKHAKAINGAGAQFASTAGADARQMP